MYSFILAKFRAKWPPGEWHFVLNCQKYSKIAGLIRKFLKACLSAWQEIVDFWKHSATDTLMSETTQESWLQTIQMRRTVQSKLMAPETTTVASCEWNSGDPTSPHIQLVTPSPTCVLNYMTLNWFIFCGKKYWKVVVLVNLLEKIFLPGSCFFAKKIRG